MKRHILIIVVFFFINVPVAQAERDKIHIVGSSAVLPFVLTVAENFSTNNGYPSPVLELTGTGNGFRLFCAGVGYETPDINAAPRLITRSELRNCQKKGVTEITEIIVGLDALILVSSKNTTPVDLTVSQLFSALAQEVEKDGKIVKNPYKKWNEISPSLPNQDIMVRGPEPNSAAHNDFLELIMEQGCQTFSHIAALQGMRKYKACYTLRDKPFYIEGMRKESMILTWLQNHPHAFAVIPFSLLKQNRGIIKGNMISGIAPTMNNIIKGKYALTRPIFLYVKTKHVAAVKGLQQFLYEFTSEHASGPEGYLIEKGFIPLDEQGRNHARDMALSLSSISR